MVNQNLKNVLDAHPTLCDFGYSLYGCGLTNEERKERLVKERQYMLDNYSEKFEQVVRWLSRFSKTKTIRKSHSSYGLKHICERDVGYITNGLFIAAAIHCGFDFQRSSLMSPNLFFNISKKEVDKLSGLS